MAKRRVPGESAQEGGAIDLTAALARLEGRGTAAGRAAMARYAIPSDRAYGVAMRDVQAFAREIGRDHALADALWRSGWYEARLLAAYVDDPAKVTAAQMDRWTRDFDNWGVCDTVCFALFDRTPHAWGKVEKWASDRREYVKRAAFALLWGLTVHDKAAPDRAFLEALNLIEQAADDDRRYVQKAVSMALRATGKRNPPLRRAALELAGRLARRSGAAALTGREAVRELRTRSAS